MINSCMDNSSENLSHRSASLNIHYGDSRTFLRETPVITSSLVKDHASHHGHSALHSSLYMKPLSYSSFGAIQTSTKDNDTQSEYSLGKTESPEKTISEISVITSTLSFSDKLDHDLTPKLSGASSPISCGSKFAKLGSDQNVNNDSYMTSKTTESTEEVRTDSDDSGVIGNGNNGNDGPHKNNNNKDDDNNNAGDSEEEVDENPDDGNAGNNDDESADDEDEDDIDELDDDDDDDYMDDQDKILANKSRVQPIQPKSSVSGAQLIGINSMTTTNDLNQGESSTMQVAGQTSHHILSQQSFADHVSLPSTAPEYHSNPIVGPPAQPAFSDAVTARPYFESHYSVNTGVAESYHNISVTQPQPTAGPSATSSGIIHSPAVVAPYSQYREHSINELYYDHRSESQGILSAPERHDIVETYSDEVGPSHLRIQGVGKVKTRKLNAQDCDLISAVSQHSHEVKITGGHEIPQSSDAASLFVQPSGHPWEPGSHPQTPMNAFEVSSDGAPSHGVTMLYPGPHEQQVPRTHLPYEAIKMAQKQEQRSALQGDNSIGFSKYAECRKDTEAPKEYDTSQHWQEQAPSGVHQHPSLQLSGAATFDMNMIPLEPQFRNPYVYTNQRGSITQANALHPAQIPMDISGHSYQLVQKRQVQAELNIVGELRDMTRDWTPREIKAGRRLVAFRRVQHGVTVDLLFNVLDPKDYKSGICAISCILWKSTDEFYVTSVDCITLLELVMNQKFSVEEKNRIRRNLEFCRPMTVSKSKPKLESFFRQIMSFEDPRPRNIVKDVKVFLWDHLEKALQKITSKYSASRNLS